MTCEIITEKMQDYIDKNLPPDEMLAYAEHLSDCPDCMAHVQELISIMEMLKDLPMEDLPVGFETELHEALEREAVAIRGNYGSITGGGGSGRSRLGSGAQNFGVRNFFKDFKRVTGYVAAVFVVGVVGLSDSKGLLSDFNAKSVAFESGPGSGAPVSEMMVPSADADAVREAPATEGMAKAEVSPVADENLKVTFNEAVGDGANYGTTNAVPDGNLRSANTPESIKRIQRAQASLEVTDYKSAIAALSAGAQAVGGYVESSDQSTYSVYSGGKNVVLAQGNLTLRVPQADFAGLIDTLSQYGKVVSQSMSTEDITAQYRDTYQEMKNLEVREIALRKIMDKATSIPDIIQVEQELSRVRSDINNYQGTLAGWDQLVSLSTVQLNITEVIDTTTAVNPIQNNLWSRAREAFVQTVNRMITFSELALIRLVGMLPFILPLALVALVALIVYRGKRGKNLRTTMAKVNPDSAQDSNKE